MTAYADLYRDIPLLSFIYTTSISYPFVGCVCVLQYRYNPLVYLIAHDLDESRWCFQRLQKEVANTMTCSSISGVMAVDAFGSEKESPTFEWYLGPGRSARPKKRSDGRKWEYSKIMTSECFWSLVHRFVEIINRYCTVLNVCIIYYIYYREGKKILLLIICYSRCWMFQDVPCDSP